MNAKKVLGIIVLIGGVAAYCFAQYIKTQVAEGKEQISSAQEKVDTGNQLFSRNPIAKEVGGQFTKGAQKKINAGKEQVQYYSTLATWLEIGGVAIAVVGAAIFFVSGKSRKR